MPRPPDVRPSPLALTVLGILAGGPLHPYAMQARMKFWGKDKVVNVGHRANLYKTIERLLGAGLIAVNKTERDQRFPERTVYELTEAGWRAGREWLTQLLAVPRNEYPEFPAALSFLFGIAPDEAAAALERRATALRATLAALDGELQDEALPPRLFLIETEYVRTMTAAELAWVESVVADLNAGSLHWNLEELREVAERFPPPD